MVLLYGLIAGGGIFLFFWSLGQRGQVEDPLEARLKAYGSTGGATLDELELALPFYDRVIDPAMVRIRQFLDKRLPEKARADLTHKLILAGRPAGLGPDEFITIRYALALILFLAGIGIGLLLANTLFLALLGLGMGMIGFYGPVYWLRTKTEARKKEILKAIPDALDLLTISVEAGLGFDASVARLCEKFHNALTVEFQQVMVETQLGRPRLEALDDMGRRNGVDDLFNFVQAVIQSEQMGVGIAKILRIQSDEIRRKRRQRAQEQAARATLKMLLPMVGCIFPTIWIVLLGPAILMLLKSRGA